MVLHSFYDMKVSPITYDFITFLILSEMERVKHNCDNNVIVIVPGDDHGFRKEETLDYSYENQLWRLKHIVIPACYLLPNTSVVQCQTREYANDILRSVSSIVYPEYYTIENPSPAYKLSFILDRMKQGEPLPTLKASQQSIEYIAAWKSDVCPGKKVVTITLRECSYETRRNSNMKAWKEFYNGLNRNMYYPVFIRDTEKMFERMEGYNTLRSASLDIGIRMALYETSYVNMFVNNGPTVLAYFNKSVNYCVFKTIVEGIGSCSKWYIEKVLDTKFGHQPIFCGKNQFFTWEDDKHTETLNSEFNNMVTRIENG
jgi:hypothetical protein